MLWVEFFGGLPTQRIFVLWIIENLWGVVGTKDFCVLGAQRILFVLWVIKSFWGVVLTGEEQGEGGYFGLALAPQKAGNGSGTGAKTKRVRCTNADYDETGDPWSTVECDGKLGSEDRDKTMRLLALEKLKEDALISQASGYTTCQAYPSYRKRKKDYRLSFRYVSMPNPACHHITNCWLKVPGPWVHKARCADHQKRLQEQRGNLPVTKQGAQA